MQVERTSYNKHLGILLDEKLNFKKHIDSVLPKISKGISVIRKLRHSLPRKSLLTIYKAFFRLLIDYGDIIYDQPQNKSFCEKLKSVQYKADVAITGAMQGTSCNKIYQELGVEPLKSRRWYNCLSCIFKIMKKEAPNYLINFILKCEAVIRTRFNNFNNNFPIAIFKRTVFQVSLLLFILNDRFWLGINIRNSESISLFKSRLLSFILLNQSNTFNTLGTIGLKLLTQLRLCLSYLNENKFRHNFQGCLNPLCPFSLEIEDFSYYLLHCQHFSSHHYDLMNSVKSIIPNFE